MIQSLVPPLYQDDGTGRVYVIGARGATGLVLTVGSEVFEEAGRSIVHRTLDYLPGLKVCFVLDVFITHTYTTTCLNALFDKHVLLINLV